MQLITIFNGQLITAPPRLYVAGVDVFRPEIDGPEYTRWTRDFHAMAALASGIFGKPNRFRLISE